MSNQLVQPSRDSYTSDEAYRDAMQAFGTLVGQSTWAAPLSLTGYDDDAGYAVTLFNGGASGKHLDITGILQVNNTGVHASLLDAVTATVTTLNATTLNVSGVSTLHATSVTSLTATGNVALGDANTDTHTIVGVTTFRNAANSLTQVLVDAGNNRVIVGSATALGSDLTPNLQVVGRLYVAPDSANDHAIQIRRSSAATNGWWLGLTTDPNGDLVFKDDGDTERFRVGDASSTYQGVVTGQFHATNGAVFDGGGLLVTAGGLTVTGLTTLNTGLTVTGTLTSNSGITLAGPSNIDGNGGTAGQIRIGAVIVNAVSLSGSEKLRVGGASRLEGAVTVTTGGASITGGLTTDTLVVTSAARIDASANKILHTGGGAKGTSDTSGYVWLPYSLGKPTGNPGSPTGSSGSVPLAIDLSNNKLHFWTGAAWLSSAAFT